METSKRVLIVEDEFLVRISLQEMIHELGYTLAASVGTLEEAQESMAGVDFDLAIVDFHLRGTSAQRILEALAAQRKPVIVTSGDSLPSVPTAGHPRIRVHLAKPYGLAALADALNSLEIVRA